MHVIANETNADKKEAHTSILETWLRLESAQNENPLILNPLKFLGTKYKHNSAGKRTNGIPSVTELRDRNRVEP